MMSITLDNKYFHEKLNVATLFAIVVLFTILQFILFDANYIHFYPGYFNDQIGYIGSARHFADYGKFIYPGHFEGTGTSIIPNLLNKGNTRLYVPGPMLMQALSFKLFGVNVVAAKLHNLLSYIGSTLLVFLIGKRLYCQKVGFYSAIIFMLLPVNVLYAMTALAELPIVLAALLAFYLFIITPDRWRIFTLAPLLVCAFLFRQTTIFMLFPMVAYWYDHRGEQPWWYAILFTTITIIFCFLASQIDVHMGRASLTLLDNLIHGHMNYGDAFSTDHHTVTLVELTNIMFTHFIKQIKYLFHGLTRPRWNNRLIDIYTAYSMIIYTSVTIIGAWQLRHRKLFPVGCALLMLSLLGVCLTLYSGILYIFVKTTFYCTAMLIIPAVAFIFNSSIREQNKFVDTLYKQRKILMVAIVSLSLFSLSVTAYQAQLAKHIQEDCNSFVESVKPVPELLLSSTPYLYTLYNIRHYPQLTGFIPANKQTLVLMNKKYPIGTMIIPADDLDKKLNRTEIESIGLKFYGKRHFDGKDYLIFKRPIGV